MVSAIRCSPASGRHLHRRRSQEGLDLGLRRDERAGQRAATLPAEAASLLRAIAGCRSIFQDT
jgi:hypothetical protein